MKHILRIIVIAIIFVGATTAKAQNDDWGNSTLLSEEYSRGKTIGTGLFLRPEYHGGWALSIGAQTGAYMQFYAGVSQLMTKDIAWTIGMRFWFTDTEFSIWMDNRYSFSFDFESIAMSLSLGVSYKDFDIGVGLEYGSDPSVPFEYIEGYEATLHPVVSIGYNIRCYSHR